MKRMTAFTTKRPSTSLGALALALLPFVPLHGAFAQSHGEHGGHGHAHQHQETPPAKPASPPTWAR